MHKINCVRENILNAMFVDGVCMPTTHLHEFEGLPVAEPLYFSAQVMDQRWITVLINEFHRRSSW
jgi:hypothetical protein